MFFLFTPAAVAALIACLQGRSLATLASQRLAWWPLGLSAFGLEAALYRTRLADQPWALVWGSPLWIAALAAMLATLGRNAWVRRCAARGTWGVAALGVGLNLLVVVANAGHMPQSQTARVAAGVSLESVAGLSSRPGWRNVAPMTAATRLAWLGDVFPQPSWQPSHNVMSVGDLLLAVGLAGAVYLATSPRRPGPEPDTARALAALHSRQGPGDARPYAPEWLARAGHSALSQGTTGYTRAPDRLMVGVTCRTYDPCASGPERSRLPSPALTIGTRILAVSAMSLLTLAAVLLVFVKQTTDRAI